MEGAFRIEQLKGKIVFVADHSRPFPAVARGGRYALLAWQESVARVEDGGSNLRWRMIATVVRKVGAQKSASSSHHVAGTTAGLAKEQLFTARWVARDPSRRAPAPGATQVGDDSANLVRFEQQAKSRHSGARDAVIDDLKEGAV